MIKELIPGGKAVSTVQSVLNMFRPDSTEIARTYAAEREKKELLNILVFAGVGVSIWFVVREK